MAFGLLYDYLMGQCIDAYQYFGAHFIKNDQGVDGVVNSKMITEYILVIIFFRI